MRMVSEKNKRTLQEVSESIEKNPVIGIVDMHNLPAKQLFQIKQQLKGKAVIRMVKKRVIELALDKSDKPGIRGLADKIQIQPALLFSDANPFELAHTIAKSVSKAAAKAGDVAPKDIIIPAGPTNLPPGPAIGELQKAKIPAGVEGDKIVVKKDTCVAKEGQEISAETADIMAKLKIEPMEISLNLVAVWDSGIVFGKDILFIPPEHYLDQLKSAYSIALNFALNMDYMTADTVPMLLSKAHSQAYSLALEAGIVTSETVGPLLAKANRQASALRGLVKDAVPAADEKPASKKPEDKQDGEEPAAEEKKEEPVEGKPAEEHEEKSEEKAGGEEQKEGKKG
ncbi:MAG: 50S ribosomal protein L10 [Candidatus Aenigmarchaeota archaeon]|nr:50S ribosomal protein L10 [Candidatus Aenigmarchaeota archaeon]